jgi:hypothetical protein
VKPASDILFSRAKFILQVSSSNTGAEMQTENLKNELSSNEVIPVRVDSDGRDNGPPNLFLNVPLTLGG